MAATNQNILDALGTMPDAIAQAMVKAMSQQSAPVPPVNNGQTANTVQLDNNTVVLASEHFAPNAVNGEQPNVPLRGVAKGSRKREIANAINKLVPGQAVEYYYTATARRATNQLFGKGAYDDKANPFDNATRSSIRTRHTSQSGKTVADGKSFKYTLPQRSAINSKATPEARANARIRIEMLS